MVASPFADPAGALETMISGVRPLDLVLAVTLSANLVSQVADKQVALSIHEELVGKLHRLRTAVALQENAADHRRDARAALARVQRHAA